MHTGNPGDKVWGVAYEVGDQEWEQSVRAQLDHREKGGYKQHQILFHPKDPAENSKEVTIYIGLTSHRQYAGPDEPRLMAQTILNATGPSGKNKDYLFNLAEAMRAIDPDDDHLFELERLVKELEANPDQV